MISTAYSAVMPAGPISRSRPLEREARREVKLPWVVVAIVALL
jgi:hypothetical protein